MKTGLVSTCQLNNPAYNDIFLFGCYSIASFCRYKHSGFAFIFLFKRENFPRQWKQQQQSHREARRRRAKIIETKYSHTRKSIILIIMMMLLLCALVLSFTPCSCVFSYSKNNSVHKSKANSRILNEILDSSLVFST